MLRPETCDKIDLVLARDANSLLQYNDTAFITEVLTPLGNYVNFTGDWTAEIVGMRQFLTQRLIKGSPGSELAACRAYHFIWRYIPPIIVLLGTAGNLLAFSVLCNKSMIHISSYIYLATLALVDVGVIVVGLLRKWIDLLLGRKIDNSYALACKLIQIAGVSTSCLSVWLIVALTVERFIVIAFPFRAAQYATPTRAKWVIILIAVLCFGISCHFFETVDLVQLPDSQQPGAKQELPNNTQDTGGMAYMCDFKTKYKTFGLVASWLDASLYSYVPFVVITLLNVVICHGVYQAGRTRASLMNNNCSIEASNNSRKVTENTSKKSPPGTNRHSVPVNSTAKPPSSSEATRQLTVMLLVVSCVFLLTTTPIVVSKFLLLSSDAENSIRDNASYQLIDAIAEMLMYANHAMNFFLYCAMGKKFRQQLARIRWVAWLIQRICGKRLLALADNNGLTRHEHRPMQRHHCHENVRLLEENHSQALEPIPKKEAQHLELTPRKPQTKASDWQRVEKKDAVINYVNS